jgi:hypothetical protein
VLVSVSSPKRIFPENLATDAVVSEIESIDTAAFVGLRLAKDFHRLIKVPFLFSRLPDSFALRPERQSHTAERMLWHVRVGENCMIKSILGVVCTAALLIGSADAQTSTTDPTSGAEMTGTIKEYTPGSVLVLETLAPTAPVQFKLSKNVTYADTDGKTIEAAGLTTNQKVRVHYTKVGGDNVADKVTLIGN